MLHEFISVLLVTEQASLQHVGLLTQRYLDQQFLKGFPHSDFSKWDNFPVPASPLFNLQAATAAIDLAKFTELNKRLTPRVVNGKWGHSRKLSETAWDKTQCFCLLDFSHSFSAYFHVLCSFTLYKIMCLFMLSFLSVYLNMSGTLNCLFV